MYKNHASVWFSATVDSISEIQKVTEGKNDIVISFEHGIINFDKIISCAIKGCDTKRYFAQYRYVCEKCKIVFENILLTIGDYFTEKRITVIGVDNDNDIGHQLAKEIFKLKPINIVITSEKESNYNPYKIISTKFFTDNSNEHVHAIEGRIKNKIFLSDVIIYNESSYEGLCDKLHAFQQFLLDLIRFKKSYDRKRQCIFVWLDSPDSFNCLKPRQKCILWKLSEQLAIVNIKIIMYDSGYTMYNNRILISKLLLWLISKQGTSDACLFMNRASSASVYPAICEEFSFYQLMQDLYLRKSPTSEQLFGSINRN
jgi:hypothetical protein